MPTPGWLCPWVEMRFGRTTADGYVPNSNGFVGWFDTALTIPRDTFSDSDLTIVNENPVPLDDEGRPETDIYLDNTAAYGVKVYDEDMVVLYTISYVSSAYLFQATQANIQTEGTVATSSPYTVQATDNTVIVDSATTPFVVVLPAAADRGTPLLIKNISSGVTVRVTPESPEEIDSVASYVELAAFTAPPAPLMMLLSDGVSAWIIASYYNG